jgi:hypothetical protein
MKTGRMIELVIMIAVLAFALGATVESVVSSSGKISTTTTSCSEAICSGPIGVYVNYSGPWGLSYQVSLENGTNRTSGVVTQSQSFFGHSPADEFVRFTPNNTLASQYGYSICFQAVKLDNSTSTLIFGFINTGVPGYENELDQFTRWSP